MILESEIRKVEYAAATGRFLKRSMIAFILFGIAIAATVPGYDFPIKYHNAMLVLTGICLLTIIIAVILATINLVVFIRTGVVRGWKTSMAIILNCLILFTTLVNVVLMLRLK